MSVARTPLFGVAIASLLLSGCAASHAIAPQLAAQTIDWASAPDVSVELTRFDFAPKELRLAAERPVRLTIKSGDGGHDFTAPEFFAAARIAPDDAGLVAAGEIDVDGGQSVTVRLIPAKGRFELICGHFGHAALGMTGSIIVE